MGPSPAPSQVTTGKQTCTRGPTQMALSGRVQHDPAVGPTPARYVNFLTYEGYSVEILGGKHFKTPYGDFVEMKSGTHYKIHVKNSHAYGKKQCCITKAMFAETAYKCDFQWSINTIIIVSSCLLLTHYTV